MSSYALMMRHIFLSLHGSPLWHTQAGRKSTCWAPFAWFTIYSTCGWNTLSPWQLEVNWQSQLSGLVDNWLVKSCFIFSGSYSPISVWLPNIHNWFSTWNPTIHSRQWYWAFPKMLASLTSSSYTCTLCHSCDTMCLAVILKHEHYFFFSKRFLFNFMCVNIYLNVCMCIMFTPSICRGQKRAPYPPELE